MLRAAGLLALLLLTACASVPRSGYVPGGSDLPPAVRAAYGEALALSRSGEGEEALRILDELCGRYPLRLGLHLARLRIATATRGPEAAVARYQPPPAGFSPDQAGILIALATLETDDLAGLRGVLEFAADREPEQPLWWLALADVELRACDLVVERSHEERELGSFDAATRGYEEARAILVRAREEAERARSLDPRCAEAHLTLGYILSRRADLAEDYADRDELRKEAGVAYEAALDIDPASVPSLVNLAENHLYFGRHDRAIRALRDASRLAPGEAAVWTNLGVAYWATGEVVAASNSYSKALALAPGNARVRVALADCLQHEGKREQAKVELARARTEAAGERPLLALIAYKLAAIHEFEGEYAPAVEEYREHIRLGGPDSAKAESRIRFIFEGRAAR
ncbi:MAG: tetratricopeptide repeat protein [Planctomycetaceae bacterium]